MKTSKEMNFFVTLKSLPVVQYIIREPHGLFHQQPTIARPVYIKVDSPLGETMKICINRCMSTTSMVEEKFDVYVVASQRIGAEIFVNENTTHPTPTPRHVRL